MTADQAKAVAETVGQQFQSEWMTTYKVLTAIPEAKRDYKPEPNSRSAWELATHMAATDVWFLDAVIKGDTVKEVLDYVEFDSEVLMRKLRHDVEHAVRAGKISYEESGRMLEFYEDGLQGYTYLEEPRER